MGHDRATPDRHRERRRARAGRPQLGSNIGETRGITVWDAPFWYLAVVLDGAQGPI